MEGRNGLILPQNGELSRIVKKGTMSDPCIAVLALALRPSSGSSRCSVWPSGVGPRRPPWRATTPRTTWAPCFRTSSSRGSSRTRRRWSMPGCCSLRRRSPARSQPPFFGAMVGLYATATDTTQARGYLDALEAEHAFWMDGAERLGRAQFYRRVVRLPDGSVLNRYWDDLAEPRPESYRPDYELAQTLPAPQREAFYRNVDRKSTRLNSSHSQISYAVFCLKKKKTKSIRSNVNSQSHDC